MILSGSAKSCSLKSSVHSECCVSADVVGISHTTVREVFQSGSRQHTERVSKVSYTIKYLV